MTESAYLAELLRRLQALLGGDLVGAYVGGSFALGDYEPGRSDLDVAAVVRTAPEAASKRELVRALGHKSLPCPARGLELVVYTRAAASTPTARADFELNLNTGAALEFRADEAPVAGELHWFAIDRSVLHAHGVTLAGPPAREVFADVPAPLLLPVLADVLRWYRSGGNRDDAVLTACRAHRFAAEGRWSSKPAAGRWGLEREGRVADPELARAALAHSALDTGRVDAFLKRALAALR